MGVHQIKKKSDYIRICRESPKEVELLLNELLICVTSFFRDKDVWEKLKEKVLPDLIKELPSGSVLRAWVTGCSTGEEAYSLAIAFIEALEKDKTHKNRNMQIFATDYNQDAIDKARKGEYSLSLVADVSPERLSRFFTVETEGRNTLIDMAPTLHKNMIAIYNFCLNPGGIKVLGTSENFNYQSEGIKAIDTKLRIFMRTSSPRTSGLNEFPNR